MDKKTATTFSLVHRAQDDPLIHDDSAPSMVFTEKQSKQPRRPTDDDYVYSSAGSVFSHASGYRSKEVKQRGDLEEEFGLAVRKNEGEAAQHGVFFDDTEYDYMQHMRDLNSGEGPVAWIEASAPPQRPKRKQKLEDALRSMDLESESGRFSDVHSVGTQSSAARSLLPEEILPSEFVKQRTYQDQQDVPDEIAGFQPDMDPELREALVALEDEEFVDDADEDDLFGQLVVDGYEIDKDQFERIGEAGMFEDEDADVDEEGWESDDTIKGRSTPPSPPLQVASANTSTAVDETAKPPKDTQAQPPADPTEGAWIDEFKKFNAASKKTSLAAAPAAPTSRSGVQPSMISGRKTAASIISSSASRARTEQQALLDARFEKLIEREYAGSPAEEGQFDDVMSSASGLSKMSGVSKASMASSTASQSVRSDFDSIVDEFLGTHTRVGKRGQRVVRRGPQTGMEQLDEVRKGLGPARVKTTAKSKGRACANPSVTWAVMRF